ncbi:MAG: hypothetical protein IPK63_16630 [Candidatus Competibacteraceae bacterium]|nr:hypothetical protein [Candidatus Competibacteraceae bacterium]
MMAAHFLKYRDIGRRLVWTGLLELASPCHLGGADADATSDRPLLRDGEGRPYLSGATLTGLLRALLARVDKDAAQALFGANWGDPEGKQARLLLGDARIASEGPVPTELRDGVAIEACSGVAAKNKKYGLELLLVGVRFHLRGQLELFGKPEQDESLLRGLLRILLALENGQLVLGARTRRGFGETRLAAGPEGYWQVEDYRLDTPAGWYAWLGRKLHGLPEDWPKDWPKVAPVAYRDTAALAKYLKVALPQLTETGDFSVTLNLKLAGSLLIGSEGHDPDQPDRSHLQRLRWRDDASTLESVLPATSLGGVLRHRCRRIALTLAGQSGKQLADRLVDEMFGPAEIRSNQKAWASRVTVREACIEVENHCAIPECGSIRGPAARWKACCLPRTPNTVERSSWNCVCKPVTRIGLDRREHYCCWRCATWPPAS